MQTNNNRESLLNLKLSSTKLPVALGAHFSIEKFCIFLLVENNGLWVGWCSHDNEWTTPSDLPSPPRDSQKWFRGRLQLSLLQLLISIEKPPLTREEEVKLIYILFCLQNNSNHYSQNKPASLPLLPRMEAIPPSASSWRGDPSTTLAGTWADNNADSFGGTVAVSCAVNSPIGSALSCDISWFRWVATCSSFYDGPLRKSENFSDNNKKLSGILCLRFIHQVASAIAQYKASPDLDDDTWLRQIWRRNLLLDAPTPIRLPLGV